MATPLATNDTSALAAGLDRVARLAPVPGWTTWANIASDGAAAARKGNISGVRAACKACHQTWREVYRASYRTRPVAR